MNLDRYRSFVPDWPRFLEAASRPEPQVFRARTGRISPEELGIRLEDRGFTLRRLEGLPGFFQVVSGPGPVSFTLEHWLGMLYVQQASTGCAAPALGPESGERILDLCSAPGGKTTHAADLMGDRGTIVAGEVNEGRIRGLLGNVYRLGHPGILVVAGDGRTFPEGARFDRVLVDAPCSGEGTLRRRGGRPPNQAASFVDYVTRAQEALLRRAIALTRPGGTVLYVTCTFAPEENEAVVSRVLQDEPVELVPLSLPVPHEPGLTSFEGSVFDPRLEGAARVYPHHFDSGGLFLARLRRLDGGPMTDSGWSPVPLVFPGDDRDPGEAHELAERGTLALRDHFGVDEHVLDGLKWTSRGRRLWLHTLEEWPVPAWPEADWRPVSVGFRALEFDSGGRPRPTNDLLRWLGGRVARSGLDLEEGALRSLLGGSAVPVPEELRGLLALRYQGQVLGRGITTEGGVRSEIPKARAKDLLAVLDGAAPTPGPDAGRSGHPTAPGAEPSSPPA